MDFRLQTDQTQPGGCADQRASVPWGWREHQKELEGHGYSTLVTVIGSGFTSPGVRKTLLKAEVSKHPSLHYADLLPTG